MKSVFCKIALSLFSIVGIFAACRQEVQVPVNAEEQQSTAVASIPKADHIVILILENHSYSEIIGSSSAPYINSLSKDPYSAKFTKSYGVTHPSQPNYIDLFSGSDQGITDDNNPPNDPFITPNLGRQLIRASLSYSTFSEGLPSVGYNGDSYGAYVRKHNPAANWMGTGKNQIPPTTNQPYTSFPTDFTKLPTVSFVIPNLNNDMHDGSISTGDTWVKNHLDSYIQWAKTHNSLFILTFDEDDYSQSNNIVTIFTGAMVKGGAYATNINHYNVLRTIETMYGLNHIGNAANVKPIRACWK